MAHRKAQFGLLNTEKSPNVLPSGTAEDARNVMLDAGKLQARYGFAEYSGVAANSTSILNMAAEQFASGDIYLVAKLAGASYGSLAYARVYKASDGTVPAVSFTTMVYPKLGNDQTYSHKSDAGWFSFWGDRIVYGDRLATVKWNPTTTNKPTAIGAEGADTRAWLLGLRSNKGVVVDNYTIADGGTKEGWYRVMVVKRNSLTDEYSCMQDPNGASVECRASAEKGLITVNAAAMTAIIGEDTAFEYDQIEFWSTTGGSEKIGPNDVPSYRYYLDTRVARAATTANCPHGDNVLTQGPRWRNSGGLPPACRVGAYNGVQALYTDIYVSGTYSPGMVMFSLPGKPSMVPGDQTYTVTAGSHIWRAEPWQGIIPSAVSGLITGAAPVGANFVIFTQTGHYWMRQGGQGRLVPVKALAPGGCIGMQASAVGALGVHALGYDTWTLIRTGEAAIVSEDRFTPTLEDIPAAYRSYAVLARFSRRNEIWAAVGKADWSATYDMVEDYDAGGSEYEYLTLSSEDASYSNDYQMWPDIPADNDAVYFGWAVATATTLTIRVNQPAAYDESAVVVWEYYDSDESGWETLTVTSDTTNPDDTSGGCPFIEDGTVTFSPAGTCGAVTVNGRSAYWIRARIATGKSDNITQIPIGTHPICSRILIFDESRGGLVAYFDPRNLKGAYITTMRELKSPGEAPKMLVGLSDGRILYWPTTGHVDTAVVTIDEVAVTQEFPYSTYWKGHFGQEQRQNPQMLKKVMVRWGAVSSGVQIGVTAMRTAAGATATQWKSVSTGMADHADPAVTDFDPNLGGNVFRFEVRTDGTDAADWSIEDLVLSMDVVKQN